MGTMSVLIIHVAPATDITIHLLYGRFRGDQGIDEGKRLVTGGASKPRLNSELSVTKCHETVTFEAERARESNSHTQAPRRGASDRSGSSARSTWRLRPTRTRAGGGAAGATGHRAGVGRDHLWGWIASTRWFVGPGRAIWHDARIVVVDETARHAKSFAEMGDGISRRIDSAALVRFDMRIKRRNVRCHGTNPN